MSTAGRLKPKTLPPLVAGQHLDQPTFHERYEAMPPDTRAELVGGIVYMPSPLSDDHGEEHFNGTGWLFHYKRFTPGLRGGNDTTAKLGPESEPQPDCQLRIPGELGGRTYIDEGGYITGAPELIVEISRSSREFDLNEKKSEYERAGVREYVVVEVAPNRVHWFVLRGSRFVQMRPGVDGIFRSKVFPGLWLEPSALYARDLDRLIEVLEQGLATPEHAAFVAKLAKAGARKKRG
jgi:hypothetical protein